MFVKFHFKTLWSKKAFCIVGIFRKVSQLRWVNKNARFARFMKNIIFVTNFAVEENITIITYTNLLSSRH